MNEGIPRRRRGLRPGFMRMVEASKLADGAQRPLIPEGFDSMVDGDRSFGGLMKINPEVAEDILRRRREQARKRLA